LSSLAAALPAKTVLLVLKKAPLPLSLTLSFAVFLAVYFLLLCLTGSFTRSDRRYFAKLLPKRRS
ncbi:MAG: hypothetical protein IJY89_00475, partial [Clostridia bacterium]|nr:hypothetical protein [Clostridia bacterium]